MSKYILAALSIVVATLAAPVFAAEPDCSGGYKIFINRVSPSIDKVNDEDLATLMRRGLSVFDACKAGDNFSPHSVWDQIASEMEAKSKK